MNKIKQIKIKKILHKKIYFLMMSKNLILNKVFNHKKIYKIMFINKMKIMIVIKIYLKKKL